jgi:hypothetical protein
MKPKQFDVEIMKDMKVGDVVTVTSEAVPPTDINPKFQGFLMAKVANKNMEDVYITINKTSYGLISASYGQDTKDWVGKELVYVGEKPFGKMIGKVWEAKVEV